MESVGQILGFDQRIAKCREQFEEVLAKATQGGQETLDAVERSAFAGLMEVGRLMVGARLEAEAAKDTAGEVVGPAGQKLPYHSHKALTYRSVFGEVEVERAYYWTEGAGEGQCPMDARLNLPARKDSYVLQEWALRMGVAQSFDEMKGGLSELLGLEVPKRQLETYARDAGAAGRTFYDEHQAPRPKEKGPILVVEADGKGVPMKKPVPAEGPKRLKKGQKRDKKKMAWVASVHTTERRRGEKEDPKPLGKEVFAELQKRERFGQELFERAQAREKGVKRKVFLGDGQREIWDLAETFFPEYEKVLDWMHASEYLWKAAYLWLPESSPEACAWVARQQKRFRAGQVKDVIREIRKLARDGTIRGKEKRKAAGKIANYYQKNRERMRYKRYRRMGLPIGTGAVEGTCRYLVKDRMERSGMRWTVEGAQAILTLRGAYVSEHWKAFWAWYRAHEARKLYGKAAVVKTPMVGVAA
ncbi:MAG: ISKra4 family transposase [Acidobacteria bacterium]|nr:ISKra4 family transposase [Acidobacteriota bacterium]